MVITARPSYSRVKTVLEEIKRRDKLELQLVVAGSALLDRYGNAIDVIENDGFDIAEKVYMVLEGENTTSMAKTTGLGLLELSNVFYNLKPDIVISIADRFETLASSIAASYQNIPLAHLQGGEVTGNIDEKVRHANTKLADYHFVSSEDARQRVIKLGENPDVVYNTGCPSIDLAQRVAAQNQPLPDVYKKYGGVGHQPALENGFIVVMQHPVTNEYQLARNQMSETLKAVDQLEIPTMWFWPNVDAGSDGSSSAIRAYREHHDLKHVHFFKNMDPEDFLVLMQRCQCMVGNSSAGIREGAFLGTPVVNIGTRQNGRVRAENVQDCDYKSEEIVSAIQTQLDSKTPLSSNIYGDGKSGARIAELLETVELKYHKTILY